MHGRACHLVAACLFWLGFSTAIAPAFGGQDVRLANPGLRHVDEIRVVVTQLLTPECLPKTEGVREAVEEKLSDNGIAVAGGLIQPPFYFSVVVNGALADDGRSCLFFVIYDLYAYAEVERLGPQKVVLWQDGRGGLANRDGFESLLIGVVVDQVGDLLADWRAAREARGVEIWPGKPHAQKRPNSG